MFIVVRGVGYHYHPAVARPAQPAARRRDRVSQLDRLAGLTPTGRAVVPIAWSLYDFANTIFSFAVVSGAIGLFLVDRFGPRDGGVALAVAVAVSVGLNAVVSPILGAISDRGGRRMPFLLAFTILCIVATFFIANVPPLIGLLLFIIANFAYQAALIYYDATLKTVSRPESRGRLSGIGTAIGYVGTVAVGLVIFLLDVPVEARFRLSAVMFALFAVPTFVFVREPRDPSGPALTAADVIASFGQLRQSIAHARTLPGLGRFLLGRFFYSDAVNTVIVVMSVVTTQALGVSAATANLILLGLTVVAIAMSFVWGWLADRAGPKRTLVTVLASWAVGLIIGGLAIGLGPGGLAPFLLAGAILGSGLGGVTVADRVLMVRLSPPERLGEFFGLYGLVGKGSQVIGTLLYGAILFTLLGPLGIGAYQVAVLSLLVTMAIGLWLVWPVRDDLAGIGDLDLVIPPERLAPAAAPLEPRELV
jgi:UMF1 family MFS transporter